ncbi:hypothetical protein GCM10017788_26000 [Amycolatopsis acidiphila]|nr:hypothetical protein GCM10017788_26000 [Amycolatopsis acidiphila]
MAQLAQPCDGLDAAHARHPQVHEDHVDVVLLGEAHRFGTVARFADDVELVVATEQAPQPVAQDGVVVDDQQPDRCHHNGTAALRVVP